MKQTDAPLLRVAASSYLNTAPLIWSFIHGSLRDEIELLTDTAPARCANMLARREADVALVPVIEYQRIPEVLIVPGVCVGSRERVRSVVLATRRADLRDVRTIALDTSSRTSAALVQIIFREFLGIEPECRPHAPDLSAMLETQDAALLIGDPAMTFPREDLYVHDLASLWREHTGLGFIFAVWMTRENAARQVKTIDFAKARDEGLAHVEEIISLYKAEINLSREELRAYLLDNISFRPDESMLKGLELYYTLAAKHDLIPAARPLKMV